MATRTTIFENRSIWFDIRPFLTERECLSVLPCVSQALNKNAFCCSYNPPEKVMTVSFDELLSHSYEKRLNDPVEVERIKKIFSILDQEFITHYSTPENWDLFGGPKQRIADTLQKLDSLWNKVVLHSYRSSILQHPAMDKWIFKFYEGQSGGPPMVTTMRVPMAARLRQAARAERAEEYIDIPRKYLIPLLPEHTLLAFDEERVNEGLVVMAEKKTFLSNEAGLKLLKSLPVKQQQTLARHLCHVFMRTGLGDCTWDTNLSVSVIDTRVVIIIIDTEPLRGELCIERKGPGYERCAQILKLKESHLSQRVIRSLQTFESSSSLFKLHAFAKVAEAHLRRMGAVKLKPVLSE